MEKTCPFVAPLNPNVVELTVWLPQVLGVTPLVLYLEASCFVVNLQYLAEICPDELRNWWQEVGPCAPPCRTCCYNRVIQYEAFANQWVMFKTQHSPHASSLSPARSPARHLWLKACRSPHNRKSIRFGCDFKLIHY